MSTAVLKESSFDYKKVSWEINVQKNTSGAYVGKLSQVPDEVEVLFNAG